MTKKKQICGLSNGPPTKASLKPLKFTSSFCAGHRRWRVSESDQFCRKLSLVSSQKLSNTLLKMSTWQRTSKPSRSWTRNSLIITTLIATTTCTTCTWWMTQILPCHCGSMNWSKTLSLKRWTSWRWHQNRKGIRLNRVCQTMKATTNKKRNKMTAQLTSTNTTGRREKKCSKKSWTAISSAKTNHWRSSRN